MRLPAKDIQTTDRSMTTMDHVSNVVKRYHTKPKVCEAMFVDVNNLSEAAVWCGGDVRTNFVYIPTTDPDNQETVSPNQYLVRDLTTGKFYPMSIEDFESSHEMGEDEPEPTED